MADVVAKNAGGKVLLVSSVDVSHPGEHIIDGDEATYWISTGLYPQEVLIALGSRAVVSAVHLVSTGVREVRIEGSQEEAPVNFRIMAEGAFRDTGGRQIERLACVESGVLATYLRVVVLSGWRDFCSLHALRVEARPGGAPTLGAVEAAMPPASGPALAAALERSMVAAPEPVTVEPERAMSAEAGSVVEEPEGAVAAELDGTMAEAKRARLLEQLRHDGLSLRFLPRELREDREVVLAAVSHSGDALQFAADAPRADRDVVLAAVRGRGMAIRWASPELRRDRKIALVAVYQSGKALQFCGPALRDDMEVALAAVGQHGSALRWASARLRGSEELVDVASRTFFFTRQELAELGEDDGGDEDWEDEHSDSSLG